jgi:hypothetical protein
MSGPNEQRSMSEHTLVSQDDSHGSCPNLCSSPLRGCARVGFSPRSRGKTDCPVVVSKRRTDKKLSEKRKAAIKVTKHGSQQTIVGSLPFDARGKITSTPAANGPAQNQDRQETVGGAESGDEHEASCCGCGFLKWLKRLFTK